MAESKLTTIPLKLKYVQGQSFLETGAYSDQELDYLLSMIKDLLPTSVIAGCLGCSGCRARLIGNYKVLELEVKDRGAEMKLSVHCAAHRDNHSILEDMVCNSGAIIQLNRNESSNTPSPNQIESSPCISLD